MENNTISTKLKRWHVNCHSFICCSKTAFTSFSWINTFNKKLFFYASLLLFLIGQTSYGQLVEPGAIKANFGIDADAYANFIGFSIADPNLPTPPGNNPPATNTDDWFINQTPPPDSLSVRMPYWDGAGLNVIDQRDGAALKAAIQGDNNYSFERRQSRNTPNIIGIPFPVVTSGIPATPYLWIDAVYGRDTNSAQSNNDSSIFTSTSDKNPDNPNTWNVGSGSVPQKDDIIDVMAHIRGKNPRVPPNLLPPDDPDYDPTDDRPFDTLYVYAAATLRATSGSKHIDFEYFRTLARVEGGVIANTGPDGGRTAFTFDHADQGSRVQPGTIIVSVDYEGGGTKPDVRIRVWMSEDDYNYLLTSPTNRPFNVVPDSFEKGLDSGVYGYARITALSEASASIWGRVNAEGSTLASPWGTLEGPNATWFEEYQTFQHVEIGIDLTAFGLDRRGTSDPCANILGSLLVKTRSCAGGNNDPFTCELKDFAGPYRFGFVFPPPTPEVQDLTACDEGSGMATFNLNNGVTNSGGGTISFHLSQSDAEQGLNAIATPGAYLSGDDTIYVRSVLPGTMCAAVINFDIIVNAINPGTIAGSQTLCTPFDPVAFTNTTSATGDGTITYQWQSSTTSCDTGFSNIGGATSATYDAPAVAVTTYFRRVATSTLNGIACSANSNCLTVTPNAINPGTIAGSQTLCTPFNPAAFTSTTAGSGGGVITYQWQMSTTNCDTGFSNIVGATSATYDSPAVAVTTYFRRVATSTLNGVACSANSNCLTVTPNAINPGTIAGSQTLCLPADPAAFTSTTAGSGDGVITYQWQMSTTDCDTGFSNIVGATSATYDAPVITVKTYYRRVATSTLNEVACSANSNCLTVTPEDIHPGEIAGSQTLCTPFDPVAFTSVTPGSNNGTITYQWQMSTTDCNTGFSNIVGATSATYDAPAVAVTTYYRRVATSTLNGVGCSANSNCLTVTPNPINPGTIAGSQTLCTPFDPVAFTSTTAGTGGGTITYQWQMSTTDCDTGFSDIGGATSATYDAPVVAVTTYFRRVATSTLNGVACSANSNCLTVTPNPITPGTIAGSQTLCTPFDPVAFTSTTAGTGGGTITYQWQMSITDCDTGFSDIVGATSATYDSPAVAVTTYFRRVAISTLNDVACSANSNCLTVTPNPINPGMIAGSQTGCSPFDAAAFTSTTDGTGGGTITYQWQMSTTNCDTGFSNIVEATSATYDAPAVTVTTYYRRVATSTLNGVACSANSNCLTVTPEICSAALCTYTQGYYGNPTGTSCAGGDQFTTYELIEKALIEWGGTMTIGLPGHSVTISNNATEINALIDVMPGGGPSKVLMAGDYAINNLPPSYLKLGKINNVLLAQTITLGLNIGINTQLGDFVLQTGTFAVAEAVEGCGGETPKPRSCNPDGTTNNEYKYYTVSQAVVDALGANNDVQGLFDLANQALGGGSTNGLSLSQITNAVDLINRAFDGCRIPIGYGVEPLVCPVLTLETTSLLSSVEVAGFMAYPVPIENELSIQCTFDYTSDVLVEVFDINGQLICSKTATNCTNGTVIVLDNCGFVKEQQQTYYVRLTTNQGSTTKPVLSSASN